MNTLDHMKKIIKATLLFMSLLISISGLISCKNKKPQPPELMSVPQLEFISKTKIDNSIQNINISIDAFYLSNEITNKEYRVFTDWVKNNPDKTLSKAKEIIINKPPEPGKTVVWTIPWIVKGSELLPTLIDSNALYKIDKQYKNYFTDKKYDDYPVVGVSRNASEFYCNWLIQMEVQTINSGIGKNKAQGIISPGSGYYRIPLELEWEFATKQPYRRPFVNDHQIHKVYEGVKNKWEISHLHDNVSEWVTASNDTLAIMRGNNWKTTDISKDRFRIHPDSSNGLTGFRIVRRFKAFKPIDKKTLNQLKKNNKPNT